MSVYVCTAVRQSWPIGWRKNISNPEKNSKTKHKVPKKNANQSGHGSTNQMRQLKRRDINQRTLPVRGKTMANAYDTESANQPDHPLFDPDTASHWIYPTSAIFARRQYQVFQE